ncbi:auxilin-like clathrin-binding protein required for normal clathrin function [Lithohypha guttulata]|uniref:Auxilin-like clathrin-binding protein required for normal clathrin function n=1 Tax=Lithohypha guttulata TaxID=1690604 RepID=A0AAN7YBU9_9EURO|nr:auxilin-like clathrin-binding protein required for normal clathrin function [Lithohypha guttulata]
MNDLNGLDWSSKPATGHKPGQGNYSAFSSLKPGPTPPVSGRALPLASNTPQPSLSKSPAPSNDSFANLVAFSSSSNNKNLSLQEQQKLREQSKLQQLVGQKQQLQNQWAGNDTVWNNLGSGRSTPALQNTNGTPLSAHQKVEGDDDLFAAFNGPTTSNPKYTPSAAHSQSNPEEDDPFGLAQLASREAVNPALNQSPVADDDDILGDLGKPIQERAPPRREPVRRQPSPEPQSTTDHPQDKAVAELVDMGFPVGKARRALEATDTGLNVQAAVGLLLNQAHEEAKQKSRERDPARSQERFEEQDIARSQHRADPDDHRSATTQRDLSATLSTDPAKAAQEFGTAFIKSAGSFWKQAQKQVQQVVKDLNSDTESGASTPKWMQEPAAPQRSRADERGRQQEKPNLRKQQLNVTDEALMLDSQRPTPPPRAPPRSRPDHRSGADFDSPRDHSPAMPSRLRDSHSPQPVFAQPQQDPLASMMRPKAQQAPRSARDMLSKQVAEDQASQAYVSSARRRKPQAPAPSSQDNAELLDDSSSWSSQSLPARQVTRSAPPQQQPKPPVKPATPIRTRPPPPSRTIPQISPIALKASHTARAQGNDYFKRGDYSSAHESYSTSLRHIPTSHPLQIVLLTNHSLTALRTGQPKVAISDADQAITLIGPSKGEAENIDIMNDDGKTIVRPMREYYGKALVRKAEALESLEKWSEAATVWRICVEDGHGGATASQGRARAEKAAAPKAATSAPARRPPTRAAPRTAPVSTKPAAAVSALRAQNQAAEKLDDEKFALADVVAARITGWKGGKEGNLRALLASLDTVLWEGAGWKKIGMADLVLPNKVKIHYMKGIGKCHPDKIPTDATTEQRMIAAAVFSTLNEAWDKFRTEHNL